MFLSDDNISSSTCGCPRGEDRCHHRAALLLYAKDNLSKTDVACNWVKRKEPQQVLSVNDMYPDNSPATLNREVNSGDRQWFLEQLKEVNRYALHFYIITV